MIQVLDRGPTVNQALGKGFTETYQPLLQRELARHQTQRAIGDIRNRSQNASPSDLLFNLIEASTLSPEIGRSLGPLFETLTRAQGARNAPGALNTALQASGGGGVGDQGQYNPAIIGQNQDQDQTAKAGFQPGPQLSPEETAEILNDRKTGNEIQNLSNKFLNQVRPDIFQPSQYGNIPTFDLQSKSALRPQEEAEIRNNLNAEGIAPEQQEQVIGKINQDIGNRYNEALKNYDILQGQQQAVSQKWNTIKEDSGKQLEPFTYGMGPRTKQLVQDKYFQYAASQPVNQTPEAVESQAMALLQRDLNQLDALKALPALPPVRNWQDVKSFMDSTKKAYAPLKAQGWDQALLEDAVNNKDMGIEEAHEAVYGDQTDSKLLKGIGNIKKGKDDAQYVDRVAKQLSDLNPDDDLILARSMVLGNGGSINDFSNALELAMQNGLQLSPFQEGQLQEIQIPRQQPLSEIFSPGKSPAIEFGLLGVPGIIFGHFFNYLRGKK